VANILGRLRQPQESAPVAVRLPHQLQITASELRRPSCFRRSHALPQKLVFKKGKMCTDLAFKIRISLSAGHKIPQLRKGLRYVPVHSRVPREADYAAPSVRAFPEPIAPIISPY
jgi:hypothetical protein